MKKLLVLDLDETLFHAIEYKHLARYPNINTDLCDFEILDVYPTFERPYLHEFLNYAYKNFAVGIWTSAGEMYATNALQTLITGNAYPDPLFVYTVDNCVHRQDIYTQCYSDPYRVTYIKDLKKLKKFGFPKEHIIAIDDSPEKYQRNYGNLIRIPPFEASPDDTYLLQLIDYLETIKDVPNVRSIDKRNWYK